MAHVELGGGDDEGNTRGDGDKGDRIGESLALVPSWYWRRRRRGDLRSAVEGFDRRRGECKRRVLWNRLRATLALILR